MREGIRVEPTNDNVNNKRMSDATLDNAIAKAPMPKSDTAPEFPVSSDGDAKKKAGRPKRRRNWLKWLICVAMVIALAAGVFWMVKQDYLSVRIGKQASRAFAEVCDDSLRQEFWTANNIVNTPRDTMDDLYKKITSKRNYEKDPNCVYMTFQYARSAFDKTAMQKAFDVMQDLNKKGINPDSKYATVISFIAMQSMITSLTEQTGQ